MAGIVWTRHSAPFVRVAIALYRWMVNVTIIYNGRLKKRKRLSYAASLQHVTSFIEIKRRLPAARHCVPRAAQPQTIAS